MSVKIHTPPRIHHLLSTDVTKFISRLDYCNSFLFGCPQYLLNKLQKVQNHAARLVLRVSKTDHISPHQLPIDLQYKLSSLCYNCLNSTAPDYLTELLRIYKPTRQLSSLLILHFSVFPLYAHTCLVKGHFLMLHQQSGTLSLTKSGHPTTTKSGHPTPMKSGHPTPSHPSNHHLKFIFFSSPTDF